MPRRKKPAVTKSDLNENDQNHRNEESEESTPGTRVTRQSSSFPRENNHRKRITPQKRKAPVQSEGEGDKTPTTPSPKRRKRRIKFGKKIVSPKSRKTVSAEQNGDADAEDMDLNAWAFSERRAIPKTDYNETTAHCPLPGCDSKGHLSGRHSSHRTLPTCPLFHNTTAEACKNRFDKRLKAFIHRKSPAIKIPPKGHQVIQRKNSSLNSKLNTKLGIGRPKGRPAAVKVRRKSKSIDAEPPPPIKRQPVNNLATELDKELFRKAQKRASQLLEEVGVEPNQKSDLQEYRIKNIQIGQYEIVTWYSAPYPEEYARLPKIYLCQFCLKYMKTTTILQRHMAKCIWRHPPGDEIYRKDGISVFEVDGKKNKVYCQNLCLLAKLFLDHKTLYFDVEPFLFYVMTDNNDTGCHIVGYFSKEKNSFLNYNVSCLLTLPQYMRQGFGKMLIDFSYLLSKKESKVGSPERPLSDLGLLSYRSYWKDVILGYLHKYKDSEIVIKDISQETAINAVDLVGTLQDLGMLKYWKGKHLVLKRQDLIDDYLEKEEQKASAGLSKSVDPLALKWTPPAQRTPTSS